MNNVSVVVRGGRVGLVCFVAFSVALTGCAHRRSSITLDGVVVDGTRTARADEGGLVRVYRGNAWVDGRANMPLQAGDQVVTGPTAYAVIRYPSGSEVFMRPGSRGRIGSLTDVIGEVFVKIRGAFAVQTAFVKAGAEGTAYLVRATPTGEATVVVFDGSVTLSSLTGAWPTMRLPAGALSVASAPPQAGRAVPPSTMSAPPEELQGTKEWVERLEKLVPEPSAVSGKGVAVGLAIAALVAIILSKQKRERPAEPQPSADGHRNQPAPASQPVR